MTADGPSFYRPSSLEEALQLLQDGEKIAISGGTAVGLLVRQGLIEPEGFVVLRHLEQLSEVVLDPEQKWLEVGAGVTLWDIAGHHLLRQHLGALSKAASVVGNPRVRALATLGGALAHGDPRQDVPAAVVALGAQLLLVGPDGNRTLDADGFATGFMETACGSDELLVAVRFPLSPGARSHYVRYTPGSATDYPVVGVAVCMETSSDGEITSCWAAIAGAGTTTKKVDLGPALQAAGATMPGEAALLDKVEYHVGELVSASVDPLDDRLGSATYKRAMAGLWAGRAASCLLS